MAKLYKTVGFLIIYMTLSSCVDELSNTCDISDPINDLPWLKEQINYLKAHENKHAVSTVYYSIAKYQGETVFFNWNCSPNVNFASYVVNCNGEIISSTIDIYDELTDIARIWEYERFKCGN